MNSSWLQCGGGDPLLPEGPLEKGAPSTLNGVAGLKGGDFGLPVPPPLLSAPSKSPRTGPIPTLGGTLCRHSQGRQAIWTSLPQAWPLPSTGAGEGMECEVAWQAGVGALLPALWPRPAPMGWGAPTAGPAPDNVTWG